MKLCFILELMGILFSPVTSAFSMEFPEELSFHIEDRQLRSFTVRPINYKTDLEGIQKLVEAHKSNTKIDFLEPDISNELSFSVYYWRDLYIAEILGTPSIRKRWVVIDDQNHTLVGDFEYCDDEGADFLIHPDYRGNGLGSVVQRCILKHLESQFGKQNITLRLNKGFKLEDITLKTLVSCLCSRDCEERETAIKNFRELYPFLEHE